MSITVTVTLSVSEQGDGYSTGEPDVQLEVLPNSPAQLMKYELQGPGATGSSYGDNYLQISETLPPSKLWIDPGMTTMGGIWLLRGSTADVGIPISSSLPSDIPVSQVTGYTMTGGTYPPQYQVVLSVTAPATPIIGWF